MDIKAGIKRTQARRIRILIKKYKRRMGEYLELANFQEPVMFMLRGNRRVEFSEKATQGIYEFEHSDGTSRKIQLNPQFLHTFDYGKGVFKGYICHEDYPTPLPEDPIITADQIRMVIDKTLLDAERMKAKRDKTKWGEIIWKFLLGLGVLIAIYGGFKFFGVDLLGRQKEVVEVVNQGVQELNVTVLPQYLNTLLHLGLH